jgi:hypothetical protein
VKDLTILIFAGDNSQSRSDLAGRLSIHLQSLAPIKILTPFEPKEYFGEWVKIEVLDYQGAMRFQVKELYKYFMTKYCLHCETDGFPINFDSWSDDFLKFDYIGAAWPENWNLINRGRVGNMGCSIITKTFLEWVSKQNYNGMPGDVFICQHLRPFAESEGFTFADIETASRFSIEHEIEFKQEKPFARHMKGNDFK